MRIIAGTARSLPLKTIEGMNTRPTSDKIKETLFNMLQIDVPGCYFLDLFAGSGQIGLEALSRGAASVSYTHLDVYKRQTWCDCNVSNRISEWMEHCSGFYCGCILCGCGV